VKNRRPQEYTPGEFDRVVSIIRSDPGLQQQIEAITGQSLEGKTPREIFNLFLALQQATEAMHVVAEYGRARRTVSETRRQLEMDRLDDMPPDSPAARKIRELEEKLDRLKGVNAQLKEANRALIGRAPGNPVIPVSRVIRGQVAS